MAMGDILTSIVRPLIWKVRPITLLIVIHIIFHFGSETQNIPVFRLDNIKETIFVMPATVLGVNSVT